MFRLNREIFVTKFKDQIQYFEDHSNLRRFGHVISVSKNAWFKRLFWLVTLSACGLGAGLVFRGALSLYTQDAVSYSVETNYLEWDTPFPSVTLCEQWDNSQMSQTLAKNNFNGRFAQFIREIVFWKTCWTCVNCKINVTCVEDFLGLVDIFRANCQELLTTCWWNDEPFPCCERFLPIRTQYGTCFVFNLRPSGTEDIEIVNRRISLPILKFSATLSIMIRVHSPDEIISVSTENTIGPCHSLPQYSEVEVITSVEQTISEVSVHAITQANRDCLFHDERPDEGLWPFPRYSYSNCVYYCKAKEQAEACNCTHHFMPRIYNLPVCDIKGLLCLFKNDAESLAINECDCPLDCEELTYKIVHASCQRFSKNSEEHKLRGTVGTVRLGQLPTLRVRRHAIRDMLGLVVDFGGVLGVFFGASLLSFLEIIYIFCIRKNH